MPGCCCLLPLLCCSPSYCRAYCSSSLVLEGGGRGRWKAEHREGRLRYWGMGGRLVLGGLGLGEAGCMEKKGFRMEKEVLKAVVKSEGKKSGVVWESRKTDETKSILNLI